MTILSEEAEPGIRRLPQRRFLATDKQAKDTNAEGGADIKYRARRQVLFVDAAGILCL